MANVVVMVLGLSGWLVGLVLLFRFRDTEVPPRAMEVEDSTSERLRLLAGRGAGGLVGAVVAGILVIGFGGRLMMRVLAASSSEEVQGLITDMEAVVGRVTVGGTIGFVVFVGSGAGIIGWLLRISLRRWLPGRSILAGLVGSGIGAGLLARSSALLDPASPDFAFLSPAWLAVGLIVGLIVTFGMLLSVLSDRWAQMWPTPDSARSALWLTPLAPLMVLPPIAVGVGVVAAAHARLGPLDQFGWSGRLDQAGRLGVGLAAIIGGMSTLAAAAEILTS